MAASRDDGSDSITPSPVALLLDQQWKQQPPTQMLTLPSTSQASPQHHDQQQHQQLQQQGQLTVTEATQELHTQSSHSSVHDSPELMGASQGMFIPYNTQMQGATQMSQVSEPQASKPRVSSLVSQVLSLVSEASSLKCVAKGA